MARTAVVAGTATAVAGGVHNKQAAAAQGAADQQASQAEMVEELKAAGVLDDAEFAAAKAKLLAS